jgi:hypothetical protein
MNKIHRNVGGTCRVFVLPGHPTHSTNAEKKLQSHYVWMKALKIGGGLMKSKTAAPAVSVGSAEKKEPAEDPGKGHALSAFSHMSTR